MNAFKKTLLTLTLLSLFLGLATPVFAKTDSAVISDSKQNITLKFSPNHTNRPHSIYSWDELKNTSFGNGDLIDLNLDSAGARYGDIIIPKEFKNLTVTGNWTHPLVAQDTCTLTLAPGFKSVGGIKAQRDLNLVIGKTDYYDYPLLTTLTVEGDTLTIDGSGKLIFLDNPSQSMISGSYSNLHIKGGTFKYDDFLETPLFYTTKDLNLTMDGGSIADGGVYSEGILNTTLNNGIMNFSESYTSLKSAAGQSHLTVNGGCIIGNAIEEYGLSIDSLVVNGGCIESTLKCPPPKGLMYWAFTPPDPYLAYDQVDVYDDLGEHRPAILNDGVLQSYFPLGTWHVSIDGKDLGSFTVTEVPQLPEAVDTRLNNMQNGDTLDLSQLDDHHLNYDTEIPGNYTIPDGLTDFTIAGDPNNSLIRSFVAANPAATFNITLKDLKADDPFEESLFLNLANVNFTLSGTVGVYRSLLDTVGGHVRFRGDGSLQQFAQPVGSPKSALIYTTGNTCVDIESGTYRFAYALMDGVSEVDMGYEQKGGKVVHTGDTYIQCSGCREGDLTVAVSGGSMELDSGQHKTAFYNPNGSVVYKQSGGKVMGSDFLGGAITQFAMIDGELNLAAANAIRGGTVNAYLGGGVMTIDGKSGYAVNSETGGIYIQRGGTLITQADNPEQTMRLEKQSISGGSIFATFEQPIQAGKEVLYAVHHTDGSLAAATDIIVRGPVNFGARTNASGLLHMYLPEGTYQVFDASSETLLGSFEAKDNAITITNWQQLDSLLSNSDGQGLRDDDIIDLSAMSGDTSGVYNIALPNWVSRAHFKGAPGKFINARFTLADGRTTPIALTIENLYLHPDEGHVIDIAQPAELSANLILSGDNSLQTGKDVSAAGIHVDDLTWQQSDVWFDENPSDARVLNSLTIDALTDDFGKMPTLNVNAVSSLGAAIGGGMYECGGDITIKGGAIQATASEGAAIGGGSKYGVGGQITIDDGYITAESTNGAPIGGGSNSDGGNIHINGGNVTCINPNTESDGTLVGSLGYARGFTTFGPANDKDTFISEANVSLKYCNLRSYNHENSEEATFAASRKDLAHGRIKIRFTDANNTPLSGYNLIIRNVDTGEAAACIRTWNKDNSGSEGLVYTYLPDGRYCFESVSEPGKIAVNDRYPDGTLNAGSAVPSEGLVFKFN